MIIGYRTTLTELLEADEISVRTCNVLRKWRIETLGDIDKKFADRSELIRLRGFGPKSLREITKCLQVMDATEAENANMNPANAFQQISSEEQKVLEEAFELMTVTVDPVSDALKTRFPTVADLHGAMLQDTKKVFALNLALSKEDNIELRKRLLRFVTTGCAPELRAAIGQKAHMAYSECQKKLQGFPLGLSYQEINTHFLTPLQVSLCERAYQRFLTSAVSDRLRIFIELQRKDYSLLVDLFDKNMEEFFPTINFGYKRLLHKELFEKLPEFKKEWLHIVNMDGQGLELEDIRSSNPWLHEQELIFVHSFQKEQGHYPMFYLLLKQFQYSDSRNNQLFVLKYGLKGDSPWGNDKLAKHFHLGTDMIRNIVTKVTTSKRDEIASQKGWIAYKRLFDKPFLAAKIQEVKEVIDSEQLGLDFVGFAALIQLVGDYQSCTVNKELLLFNNTRLSPVKLKNCFDSLCREGRTLRSKEAIIPLNRFLYGLETDKIDAAVAMLSYVATQVYHFSVNDSQELVCPVNMVDVRSELEMILQEEGQLLDLGELHIRFSKKFPHIPMTRERLKEFLSTSKGIKAQGLSNRYGLAIWEHVIYGTIRDLLVDLMNKADRPLHVNELLDGVIKHFPETNKHAICSNLALDNKGRFASFGNGLYGIASRVYPGYSEEH